MLVSLVDPYSQCTFFHRTEKKKKAKRKLKISFDGCLGEIPRWHFSSLTLCQLSNSLEEEFLPTGSKNQLNV
jgi:hypothetical protein